MVNFAIQGSAATASSATRSAGTSDAEHPVCVSISKKKLYFLKPCLDSVSTEYPDIDDEPELNAEMTKRRQKDLDRTCTAPMPHTLYVSLLTTLCY